CAHCHRHGGSGTAPFELLYEHDLKKLALVDTRPAQGTFDIRDARNVSPGDPYRSVLYYRMAKLGRGRMPQTGADVVDQQGLDLSHDWIQSLPPGSSKPSVSDAQREALRAMLAGAGADQRQAALSQLLATTSGSLYLLRAIDAGQLSEEARKQVLAAAAIHPEPLVRDLFERFIPEEQRVKRLGNVIKPAEILTLKGDAERGRKFFFREGSQCKSCHRVGKEGGDVGPELTLIAQKQSREQLLESILE